MTVGEALAAAGKRFVAAGIEDAAIDAGLLLEAAAGIPRAEALAHPSRALTGDERDRFLALVARRERREPAAYLTGRQEFMGLVFSVGVGVLVPRADTETLAEEGMRHLHDGMRFMDLCTGTGCVALSLLNYSNDTTAVATELSDAALSLARENGEALGLKGRVEWVKTDLYPPTGDRFDLILANPPYIPTGELEGLMPEVRDFEPREALDGGRDGLDFYRRILERADEFLCSGGWLLVEIGYDQGEAVRALFDAAGFHDIEVVRDLGGQDRVVKGCLYGAPAPRRDGDMGREDSSR